jgi:ferredoxin
MYIEYRGKRILILEGQTILNAMESMGFTMNYQCRDGICGTCRCKLISGKIRYSNTPLAMIREGEVLICVAEAVSNLKICH